MNHRNMSFVKSTLRIVGLLVLAGAYSSSACLIIGIIILVLAELLGIFEELL